ncbi:MAG: MBL fold metallo-hydrolase [Thiotrichaceae bacterium]|nr:MBL fold metallo-hydrolase [Thiotrichaceae bacterium]
MIFKQLFEPDSCTYTYLLGCPDTGETVLIDPVIETVERDLKIIQSLGLKPTYTLETHIHADHLTGAKKMKALASTQIVVPKMDQLPCADLGVEEGKIFQVGHLQLEPLFTPGHTSTHHAYLIKSNMHTLLFSGDALLIEACGRTDFQSGDAKALYQSIHQKFFNLDDETLVYPGHDYEGRQLTTIGQEKQRNPRLGHNRPEHEFIEIMDNMDLPYPKKIDFAVPGNSQCGQCPDEIPEEFKGACEIQNVAQQDRIAPKKGDQG